MNLQTSREARNSGVFDGSRSFFSLTDAIMVGNPAHVSMFAGVSRIRDILSCEDSASDLENSSNVPAWAVGMLTCVKSPSSLRRPSMVDLYRCLHTNEKFCSDLSTLVMTRCCCSARIPCSSWPFCRFRSSRYIQWAMLPILWVLCHWPWKSICTAFLAARRVLSRRTSGINSESEEIISSASAVTVLSELRPILQTSQSELNGGR